MWLGRRAAAAVASYLLISFEKSGISYHKNATTAPSFWNKCRHVLYINIISDAVPINQKRGDYSVRNMTRPNVDLHFCPVCSRINCQYCCRYTRWRVRRESTQYSVLLYYCCCTSIRSSWNNGCVPAVASAALHWNVEHFSLTLIGQLV